MIPRLDPNVKPLTVGAMPARRAGRVASALRDRADVDISVIDLPGLLLSVGITARRGDRHRGRGAARLCWAHGAQGGMKFVEPRPYADPKAAARKLMELANAFEPIQDARIYIVWKPANGTGRSVRRGA